MQYGLIGNIQRFSLHDGPGIRTTVFLKGCPLSCLWCHNPENRCAEPEIVAVEGRCMRCGRCAEVCPQGGVVAGGNGRQQAPTCKHCGACVEVCPTGARQTVGQQMSVAEVLAEVGKDGVFYEESGGGVTFSGGEPLMQSDFLKALLEACAAQGIHTAVDTCGFAATQHLLAVVAATDLFLYDLKTLDDAKHARLTGVSNAIILENLRLLGCVHHNIWLRIPIIPGLNDSAEELDALARFAASMCGVRQINLLPYHRTGVHKFQRLGRPYELADVRPPSPEYMAAVSQRFAALGLRAKIGG